MTLLTGRGDAVAPAEPVATKPRGAFRPDVEGMRSVAIVVVVLFHAGLSLLPGGYVGVDVFFVLSGFLITGLLLDEVKRTGTISIANFYARRARRLLPLSALVLVATAIASRIVLAPLELPEVAADERAAGFFYANWHFAASAVEYMSDTDKSPVLHFWSLSVEEQFYVVWPLVILLLLRRGSRQWTFVARRIALALAVIGVVSFVLSVMTTGSSGPFAYFGLHTRAWELAAGGGLALARPLLPRIPRAAAAAAGFVGLGMVLLAAVMYDETTPFPGKAAALPILGTVLLLAAGAGSAPGPVSRALSTRVPMYIGRISYSWYLWHWPVLILAGERYGKPFTDADGAASLDVSVKVRVTAVVASFVLAAVSHHLIENPVRMSSWLSAVKARSLVMGATLTVAAVVASVALAAPNPVSIGAAAAVVPGRAVPGSNASAVLEGTNLRVTPAQAAADRPRRTACYVAEYTKSEVAETGCTFGAEDGSKVIALVGDSHAEQWLPPLQAQAAQRGWTLHFWGKANCSFIDAPLYVHSFKGRYTACDEWRKGVVERLDALPRLDAVVIGRSAGYKGMAMLDNGRKAGAARLAEVWEPAAKRTFDALGRLTPQIVVLRDTPIAPTNIPKCLSEALPDVEECEFPHPADNWDGPLFGPESRAAAGRSDVSFVDLNSVICPGKTCPVATPDGLIMYRDQHHLSRRFSVSIAPELGSRLAAVLR
jgi:peptidoglycan/LPS O-acetylase OafA/YrhL